MGIVLKNLINIRHFVSNNLYEQLEGIVDNLNKKELIQMYDELNVYDTKLLKFSKTDENLTLLKFFLITAMIFLPPITPM